MTQSSWGDLPTEMRIGPVRVAPNAILAPMEGVTDLTFRRLIRGIGGCGLTVTEFVPAKGLSQRIQRAQLMAEFDADERPIAIQIYGNEPPIMARGASIVQDLGADILDVNMGCPSKKVCHRSGGSALMKSPELVRDIVRAMRAAVDIPLTVKMRAGWDPSRKNAPEIAWICQEEGADAVAVHWRTREDKYGGVRELDTIRAVKDRLSIPVSANGDVICAESARTTLQATGCDGLMIGRGAIRNPWIFVQLRDVMEGRAPRIINADEKERALLGYMAAIRSVFYNDRGALGRFKKIARYFTAGVPFGNDFRQQVFHSQSIEEATDVVHSYFDRLRAWEAGDKLAFALPELSKGEVQPLA